MHIVTVLFKKYGRTLHVCIINDPWKFNFWGCITSNITMFLHLVRWLSHKLKCVFTQDWESASWTDNLLMFHTFRGNPLVQKVWLQIPTLSQNTCATLTTSIWPHKSIFLLSRLFYLSVHVTIISHSKVLIKLGKSGLAAKWKKILNLIFTAGKIKVICIKSQDCCRVSLSNHRLYFLLCF